MKKPETTELDCVELCTTWWTSQWTDLQNNTGEKSKTKIIQQRTQTKLSPDTKPSFIFLQ